MQQRDMTASSDELTLAEVWQVLVANKKWVLGIPLLAFVAALIAVTVMKPEWEASAAIQVGAVGTDQGKQLVEPVPRVIARMKLKAFEDAVLGGLKVPLSNDATARQYRKTLKAKALPNTDLIEIKVRGRSPQEAQRLVEGTVAYLHDVHKAMAQPSIARMRQLLAQVDEELSRIKVERETALHTAGVSKAVQTSSRFTENVLRDNILIQRDRDVRLLEQTKAGYKEQLDAMRTYPTSYIEKISISDKPVAPKKVLIIFVAAVVGLLAGVIAAFLVAALRSRRT